MTKAGYTLMTAAVVPLVAATPKSTLSAIAPAQFGVDLQKFRVSYDGVTASAVPVFVELCVSTQGAAGTSGTAVTVNQVYGRAITAGFTGGSNFSAEPTTLTAFDGFWLDPNKGFVMYDWGGGTTPDTAVSQAMVIRCTAPAAVNVRAALWFERT